MPLLDSRTLDLIVEHYRSQSAQRQIETRWWQASGLSFQEACRRAACSEMPDGKMHPHQRRPGRAILKRFAQVVADDSAQLFKSRDFEDILSRIDWLSKWVDGAGALVVYDVADRIALHCNFGPKKIYLHAGTRDGAHVLGLRPRRGEGGITVKDLPGALQKLSPREAEDILCSYKGCFPMRPYEFEIWREAQQSNGGCRPTGWRKRRC